MIYIFVVATAFGVVIASAVMFVAIALVAAKLLPRGHPFADRLRRFAGAVPRVALRALGHAENVVFILVVATFAVLAIAFA